MTYRFSPIKSQEELIEAIEYLHVQSNKMCFDSFGMYLPNAGNIGIFCHYEEEFKYLTELRKELTYPSSNSDQKYFTLKQSIIVNSKDDIQDTEYKYLYIRKPKQESSQVGDIDFYLEDNEFNRIKSDLLEGKLIRGARLFDRTDLNMIELFNPDIDVLTYVSTLSETERVRIRQSEATIL